MCKPMEFGGQLFRFAVHRAWQTVQQIHGLKYEEAHRIVSYPSLLQVPDTNWNRHEDEVSKNTRLDMNEIKNITYLHEFDRFVPMIFSYDLVLTFDIQRHPMSYMGLSY